MIFASPTADIDQKKPVTTTFPPDDPDTPAGVAHEDDAPAAERHPAQRGATPPPS